MAKCGYAMFRYVFWNCRFSWGFMPHQNHLCQVPATAVLVPTTHPVSQSPLERKDVAMQPPDNFIPVIPVDDLEHTPEKPFCWDSSCPCHEDDLLIEEVSVF